ncbi:hypothetical protein BEP19_04105 [Ammoniphilus oxalaticus]|uniref:Excisionase n=1 Tax=Ammoniphilus oxalaticus TaxID=66863 RepID=A0A419SLS7_9BACL|nr:helix-turn-helix transcriptional regulator [Ammoniphilus oxalaticus]RKD25019.1 hypothetical protein BEP19_04105 [Ammoniphilus oxalaticus]
MTEHISYTTEELAQILKVSKLTVYDLIKKGELPSYRVGRQMRVDARDLEAYIEAAKTVKKIKTVGPSVTTAAAPTSQPTRQGVPSTARQLIISGQDISLDILANHLEKQSGSFRPLRSYVGSLNSLIAMYLGEADIVSTHLFDGDTGEYNVPYVKRILVGHSYTVVNLLSRWAGFYVKQGNPKNIQTWSDLTKANARIVNREKGSGVRILLDEKLRIEGISPDRIKGYDMEETNHVGVATRIANDHADVGIGIEKTAQMVGIDFIPMIEERYDLVILKTAENQPFIRALLEVIRSDAFQQEINALGGYNLSQTGKIIYET